MSDYFQYKEVELGSPAGGAFSVTPADEDLDIYPRALWVGGSGNLVVTMLNDEVVTFVGASGWMPIRVKRVNAATGASSIVAVY